ncbi:hypothetical protein ACLOJK_030925 [Asimina triloba]
MTLSDPKALSLWKGTTKQLKGTETAGEIGVLVGTIRQSEGFADRHNAPRGTVGKLTRVVEQHGKRVLRLYDSYCHPTLLPLLSDLVVGVRKLSPSVKSARLSCRHAILAAAARIFWLGFLAVVRGWHAGRLAYARRSCRSAILAATGWIFMLLVGVAILAATGWIFMLLVGVAVGCC